MISEINIDSLILSGTNEFIMNADYATLRQASINLTWVPAIKEKIKNQLEKEAYDEIENYKIINTEQAKKEQIFADQKEQKADEAESIADEEQNKIACDAIKDQLKLSIEYNQQLVIEKKHEHEETAKLNHLQGLLKRHQQALRGHDDAHHLQTQHVHTHGQNTQHTQ